MGVMKMKKKAGRKHKWVLLGVLMLLAAVLLFGCGGAQDVEEPQGEVPSQEEGSPEEGGETPVSEPEETPATEPEEGEAGEEISKEELSELFTSGKDMDEFYYEMKVTGMGEEE